MGKMDVLSAFLQKVISHPILWHTQYVQSFLDLDKTDWGEVIKSIKKAKPNLNFLEKITVDFKYRDMMPEYKKSLIYFNNYLNNVETQLKDLQSSWSNNLHSEMVYKKNLQKYSNSIENISKNGLEWREPNSFEFQNGNKSTENTRSSLTGLCQSFSTILDSLEKTNKNITHNLSHNLNDIFTEISGFKQLFKRMEHLQKRVDAHYQNHLKSIHTSNYNTVKLEKKMMKENKKQLDVFRLSMLAESELFRESLLNNINSSMVDFLQNQLNFHKNSVNTYQSALDSFNSIQVEKGSSYCEMQK
ncbi:sorting nexin [Anaeramoeba flamelloides]|uniref:Sorting nexin n=1 Tax=Anaeramoeba flamelloides TaxID=1746091 RepID=A0AAV7ZP51_9EUKA|nr:sorting nexin [Anaeramoeba flamelloides]